MSRLLAIEWDNREVRVAVATPRAGGAAIDDAFAIPLTSHAEGGEAAQTTGERIAAALAGRHIGRVTALAAVGRTGIELKQLSLPPAPDDELPDLVRFQAMREFHSLGEDWPLDFIPLAGAAGAPRKVLAAAIAPELVDQIRQTCSRAKLTPERLVLRSCAAASLLARSRWESVARVKLLVDLLAEEADLTVLVENEVVFMRTVRVPAEPMTGGGLPALVGEIRRTVAAARNQVGGLTIEAIYLVGSGPEHGALAGQLETQVGIATHGFDPFAGLMLSSSLARELPTSPGRFAPVLGMLLDEADRTRHTVDFFNPRRRPAPPSRRRQLLWAAAAACVVLAAGFSWINGSLAEMDDEIAKLQTESKRLDKPVDQAKEKDRAAQEIGFWADGDVNWLDELRELALDLPPARDVLLTRLNMGASLAAATGKPATFAGQIDLEGLLRGADSAAKLEEALRDKFHSVQGRHLQQDSSREGYGWKFVSAIAAAPESAETYREHATAAEGKRAEAEKAEAAGPGRFGSGGFGGDFGDPMGGFGDGWGGWPAGDGGSSPPKDDSNEAAQPAKDSKAPAGQTAPQEGNHGP